MTISDRDIQTLQHLYNRCEQVRMTKERFNMDILSYMHDFVQQNAISMPLLQIGELVKTALTDEFKTAHKEIPWHQMSGMRNRFAHDYDDMDPLIVWDTIEKGVPELSKFCKEILTEEHEFVPYNPDLQENSEIHDCGR